MKKILLPIAIIAVLGLGGRVLANTPESTPNASTGMPSSVINSIEVPYNVLDYAQMKHQGYAVTHATRSTYRGEQVYRLHVDNDDILYDDDYILLIFDLNWKLMNEQKTRVQVRQKPNQSSQPKPEQGHQSDIVTPEEPRQESADEDEPAEQEDPEEQVPDTPEKPIIEPPQGRGRSNN